MTPRPPSDNTFELVPSTTPGKFDFRVARSDQHLRPDSAIAAGTTYEDCALACKPRLNDGWAAYVAAQREKAVDGYEWQYFVAALPTTPTVVEDIDPIFGKVFKHEYLDLITNSRPDRADDFSTGTTTLTLSDGTTPVTLSDGVTPVTLLGTRKVRDVQTQDLGQGLCKVVVTTAANAEVQINSVIVDTDTGTAYEGTDTHTLTATQPAGAPVGEDGFYTGVTRPQHNHWLRTRRKSTTLPTAATPRSWDTEKSLPIVWPAVMLNPRFVALGVPGAEYFQYKLVYAKKESYSSPVPCNIRQWWQKEAPAPLTRLDMIAGGGRLGSLQPIDVPECLHPELVFEEPGLTLQTVIGSSGAIFENVAVFRDFTYTLAATTLEDWPETYPIQFSEPMAGGFLCTLETYSRPESSIAAETTIGTTRPDYGSFLFYPQ